MKVVFQGVTTENVVKGKSRYTKAVVTYTYNGEARSQTMMSFSNPTIFKQVQELAPGTEIDVDIGKNDAGYNEWKSIQVGGSNGSTSNASAQTASTTRVSGSNYETREERASRQVLIVKQSSLAQAVASHGPDVAAVPVDQILDRAQTFADWIFQQAEEDAA
jgi:hypothetical protein